MFWSIWDGNDLAGIGALKHLSAKRRGYTQLSLERGSMEFFVPARAIHYFRIHDMRAVRQLC